MSLLPPVPIRDDVLEPQNVKVALGTRAGILASKISVTWQTWLRSLVLAVNSSSQALGQAALSGATAATAPTAIQTPTLNAGLYRVSWYARITTPASVSSSLTVTIHWTDGGIVCSVSGAAMTGNTTSTVQSGSVLVQVDPNTTINYETAYTSVGTPMAYALDVVAELVA